MKKIIALLIIFILIPANTLAVDKDQDDEPVNVKIFVNDKQILFSVDPVNVNNTLLLPLREIAESLNIAVKWDERVILEKGDQELSVPLGTKKVLHGRRVFFMEQPLVIINGRTMVSLRFITAVLGADVSWDESYRAVYIMDNAKFLELPPAISNSESNPDKYYKWFDILVGPNAGPGTEEAKEYILKQGLINEVREIQRTYTRFDEVLGFDTMVSGIDENGQERMVWLTKDKYIGEISITGSVSPSDGLSQEAVVSILEKKGLDRASIKKLYISPYTNGNIMWLVEVEQDKATYHLVVDFYTGVVYDQLMQNGIDNIV